MWYLVWKLAMLTLAYGMVLRWHHKSNPAFDEVSAMGVDMQQTTQTNGNMQVTQEIMRQN